MSDYEIYAQNLLSNKGFAPWRPGPVHIAEVGYAIRGKWIRLFDASLELDDKKNDLGIPKGYLPLVVGQVDKGTLCGGLPITNERGTTQQFGAKRPKSMFVLSNNSNTFISPLKRLITQDNHAREWPVYLQSFQTGRCHPRTRRRY